MQKIYEYIKPYSNDDFSKMSKEDLEHLYHYLKSYKLELRNNLFDKNITFGTEIEFEYADKIKIAEELKKFPDWTFKSDISLVKGAEVVSSVLIDEAKSWEELKGVCEIISNNAHISSCTSAHVHIGSQILNDRNDFFDFIKLWVSYEDIIVRYAMGEFNMLRPMTKNFAHLFYKKLVSYIQDASKYIDIPASLMLLLKNERNNCVNFKNFSYTDSYSLNNTIEFRLANGTFNYLVWQNNINLYVKLLLCRNKEAINAIFDTLDCKVVPNYSDVNLKKALEFVDLIFDKNIDKISFLKQYLKLSDNSEFSKKFYYR